MICFVNYSFANEILVKEIASKVNKENIEQIIKDFSGYNPVVVDGHEVVIIERFHSSEFNIISSKYIRDKFIEYNYKPNFVSVSPSNWTSTLETVYAIKVGKSKPNSVVLFSANFETVNPGKDKPITDTMPGANLNATGIAVMLEAAKLLSNYESEKTIIFAAFDDCNNSGYGPGHLLDSLRNVDLNSREYIFLTNLGRELQLDSTTIISYDTLKAESIINSFKVADEILSMDTRISKIVKAFTTLGSPNSSHSEITFSNVFRIKDTIAVGKNDNFENLNLDYLNDNSKLAISALSVLAEVIPKNTSVNSNEAKDLGIYPNPAFSYFTISEQSNQHYERYEIYDITGRKLHSELLSSYRIDISGLEQGTYYLRLYNSSGMSVTTGFVKIDN